MSMFAGINFKRRLVASTLIAAFLVTAIGIIGTVLYTHSEFLLDVKQSVTPSYARTVIFPKSFDSAKSPEALLNYYALYLQDGEHSEEGKAHVIRYGGNGKSLSPKMKGKEFNPNTVEMFDVNSLENCQQDVKDFEVGVASTVYFDRDIETLSDTFVDQMMKDEAFAEFKDRMYENLIKFRSEGVIDTKWFKFSGSSVWLKEYGVHMMVSRAVYSARGNRLDPDVSFMYAQLFNADWQELKGYELVLPIINEHNDKEYQALKFPRFLSVPFYFDKDKRFLGPEDPRMLLYKGEHGEEPIIVCNSDRREVSKDEDIGSQEGKIRYDFKRTMFVVYPFRKQRGKFNVLGSTKNFDNILYNKATALSRDLMGGGMEKNWTPMLSYDDLEENGYHKNIYFIYRWQNLEVLKCRMSEEHQGKAPCDFAYKRGHAGGIGPLRGGTEMLNIRDIAPKSLLKLRPDKEIWVGFPRAHISGCGCGKDMYRPNFSVITKEGDAFKISQLSSYMGLDVWVEGWKEVDLLCVDNEHNALIPNGVSDWSFDGADDYVTMSLSIADRTNVVVQIKNLFKALLRHTEVFAFDRNKGYNEKLVDCGLEASKHFCKAYGDEMRELGKTPPPKKEEKKD